jgi:hypothetical protein
MCPNNVDFNLTLNVKVIFQSISIFSDVAEKYKLYTYHICMIWS